MTRPELTEPEPVWTDAPRYCPERALPPYRFVAGLNPHPTSDPGGHSVGVPEAPATASPPAAWRENASYLFGIDLYHQGYFWESHEAWEGLWRLLPRPDPQAQFYQGLIKNSAAQIKAHAGVWSGARALSEDARRHLSVTLDSGGCGSDGRYMGLHVASFVEQMDRHYGFLWRGTGDASAALTGPPPRIALG